MLTLHHCKGVPPEPAEDPPCIFLLSRWARGCSLAVFFPASSWSLDSSGQHTLQWQTNSYDASLSLKKGVKNTLAILDIHSRYLQYPPRATKWELLFQIHSKASRAITKGMKGKHSKMLTSRLTWWGPQFWCSRSPCKAESFRVASSTHHRAVLPAIWAISSSVLHSYTTK